MSDLSTPNLRYFLPRSVIEATLRFFQAHGRIAGEGVALWGGTLTPEGCHIRALIIPKQRTTVVSFRIPTEELVRIINWAADHDIVLAVQVHSHPEEAFHSEADDHLAVLQHLNAISIVVPEFGHIFENVFFQAAAAFTLRSPSRWTPLSSEEMSERFVLVDEPHELDYATSPDPHSSERP